MTVTKSPTPGEDIQILARPNSRLRRPALLAGTLEPESTPEPELLGNAEPVERRKYVRQPVEVEVLAWTLAQPTRRLEGNTVDLSPGGALLWLPELAPGVAWIELTVVLSDWHLHTSAGVRWRRDPALVGVDFDRIGTEQQARVAEFLRRRR